MTLLDEKVADHCPIPTYQGLITQTLQTLQDWITILSRLDSVENLLLSKTLHTAFKEIIVNAYIASTSLTVIMMDETRPCLAKGLQAANEPLKTHKAVNLKSDE